MSSLDPRSKLVVTAAATIVLMAIHRWLFLGVALAILIMAVLSLRLGRLWLNFLRGLGIAVLSFFVIAWVAFDLMTGIVAGLRLLTLGTVFFLFFQATSPGALSNALVKIGIPYPFAFVAALVSFRVNNQAHNQTICYCCDHQQGEYILKECQGTETPDNW